MKDGAKKYVLDASVVLKWVLNESEHKRQAQKLQEDFMKGQIECSAPAHLFAELSNTLGRTFPDFAITLLSQLKQLGIREYILSPKLCFLGVELMQKASKISFYDAAYHALALQEKAIFITADSRYYKDMHKEGNLLHLKDY